MQTSMGDVRSSEMAAVNLVNRSQYSELRLFSTTDQDWGNTAL